VQQQVLNIRSASDTASAPYYQVWDVAGDPGDIGVVRSVQRASMPDLTVITRSLDDGTELMVVTLDPAEICLANSEYVLRLTRGHRYLAEVVYLLGGWRFDESWAVPKPEHLRPDGVDIFFHFDLNTVVQDDRALLCDGRLVPFTVAEVQPWLTYWVSQSMLTHPVGVMKKAYPKRARHDVELVPVRRSALPTVQPISPVNHSHDAGYRAALKISTGG
jgi:hypothetical protein